MNQEQEDIIDILIKDWKAERSELDASAMAVVGRILKLGEIMEKRAGNALQTNDIYYTDRRTCHT